MVASTRIDLFVNRTDTRRTRCERRCRRLGGGKIWSSRVPGLNAKFSRGTGDELKPEIKVLDLVRAEFHPVHGFALIIEDTDPSFTLGALLAKLNAIRATLAEEGVFETNKRLPAPREFVRVAVICPAVSAGEGDFRSEANRLQGSGLCAFDYYTATFQGSEAPRSIRGAIRTLFERHGQRPYDAVAIIRGGGSKTDLAWLNDLQLARWVCRLPIPVLTGIGHERDSTILDEIAHLRFDTPSKVALHIAQTIRNNAWDAISDLERIRSQVGRILAHRETMLTVQRDRLTEQVGQNLERAEADIFQWEREVRALAARQIRQAEQTVLFMLDGVKKGATGTIGAGERGVQRSLDEIAFRSRLQLGHVDAAVKRLSQAVVLQSQRRLDTANRVLDHLRAGVASEGEHWIVRAAGEMQSALNLIQTRTTAIQRDAGAQVESYARTIIGMGPQSTLERGYAIVHDPEGNPVSSKAAAMGHEELAIQFRDGKLEVENREYPRETGP